MSMSNKEWTLYIFGKVIGALLLAGGIISLITGIAEHQGIALFMSICALLISCFLFFRFAMLEKCEQDKLILLGFYKKIVIPAQSIQAVTVHSKYKQLLHPYITILTKNVSFWPGLFFFSYNEKVGLKTFLLVNRISVIDIDDLPDDVE